MVKSILQGVDDIIDEALGLKACTIGKAPHYTHLKSCQMLSKTPISSFDGEKLIQNIYKKIGTNFGDGYKPSQKNWRIEPQLGISVENASPEVRLEKAIVNLPTNFTRDWVNAVPTSSGFVSQYADKKRNIDLVHKCGDRAYEFIELKVESNTPLYAAMEILQYGILYIFSRLNRKISDAATEKKLLEASTIHLIVLATVKYYEECKFGWLKDEICKGLKSFLTDKKDNLQMDFRFEAFPIEFILNPLPLEDKIQEALEKRETLQL